MFQSAITCRDYQKFIDVCKESREEAEKLLCRYTNTDQELLNDVILSIWEGKTMPHIPFNAVSYTHLTLPTICSV